MKLNLLRQQGNKSGRLTREMRHKSVDSQRTQKYGAMDLDILNQHSSSFPRIAIWATCGLLLLSYQGCQAIPGGSSGER